MVTTSTEMTTPSVRYRGTYTRGMVPYQSPVWHPAFEEYCETIFELTEDHIEVIQARIAERLDISRPAVSEMVKRMEGAGLLTATPRIALTDDGMRLAETVVRRHRIAERFLTDILGLSLASAHKEAGKWEHVISPAVEKAMVEKLDNPKTCPHGNPIPGSGYIEPDLVSIGSLPPGQKFTVVRIKETLEFTPGLLEYLETHSVTPGFEGTVSEVNDEGDSTIVIGDLTAEIDRFAGSRILVSLA